MLNAISWCHIQAGYTSVQLALEQKHEATVEVLLEAIVAAGMDIDARYESRRERGQTLLMRASALGLTSTAAKLLALGADIAAKDANGKGVFDHTKEIKDEEKRAAVLALMAEYSVLCAVATGKADLVAAAVAKGCNMHDTDQEGNSCLHIAAAQGSNEILRILLNAGAKVSAKNKWCKTALDVATNDEVKAALRQHGARHSLFYAAEQGMLELVADLIKEGANVNERNQNGKGAFDHTKKIKDEEKRAAVLALMAEYSVLCAVATGKADLVAAAVAKGCTVHETDQVDRYACMCMCVCVCV